MASASVIAVTVGPTKLRGSNTPATAREEDSVVAKREPSSSPKASTSMPNGSLFPPRAICTCREDTGHDAQSAVITAGVDHRVDVRADQQRAVEPLPDKCPRTVPSASSLTSSPASRIQVGNEIGGASMFWGQEQTDQPVRLGRNFAKRGDHRFGPRAQVGNIERRCPAGIHFCAAIQAPILSRSSWVMPVWLPSGMARFCTVCI